MKQKEGSLQERIQKIIERKGGYVNKNHGDMTSEPGIPDLSVGYKGLAIYIECKVDNNTPSKHQGIHCRNIWKAGNIAFITWDTQTVYDVLSHIDECIALNYKIKDLHEEIIAFFELHDIDDGRSW